MAQEWVTPVINGYGKIKYSKNIAVQPDSDLEYKLVYKITTDQKREGINRGLNGIAHAINMLGCVNIPRENIKIVATIQGPATNIILKNEEYQKRFGEDNPNTKIIELLSQYGVKLFVCSQATAYKKIPASQIDKNVTEALSGSSVIANYQLNGYALMQ
tara:strand:- start:435 stop:911 length:477 start_codon:yes stop_codon:yes gene_type:complete